MAIKVKRVYEAASDSDGLRILVDSLWPRGLSKAKAGIDIWLKDVAPSDGLRKWFSHDPQKWDEFRKRYFDELSINPGPAKDIADKAGKGDVTLLFGAKDLEHNNALALKEYLLKYGKRR
jgi:uncharacterized protein YeaO (DUF488 family)